MDRFAVLYNKIKMDYDRGRYESALRQLYALPQKTQIPAEKAWLYHQAMGMCLFWIGSVPEALRHMRQSLDEPGNMPLSVRQRAYSNYAMYLHYLPGISDEEMREAHFRYGSLFEGTIPFSHRREEKEKIRVGYLSPDIVDHIVTNFAIQLFAQYNRDRFEVIIYSVGKRQNEVTDWLFGMVNGGRDLSALSPQEAAKRIYEDRIDILFDLAGHTEGGGTLQIAAYRPAPVQISGIGYFDTTGLSAMDYFLTDAFCDPPENDALFTEKLIRLPRSHLCYTPSERFRDAPVGALPHSPVVFGSFNNFSKISDEMLVLWRRILERVPGSRLVLKNVSPSKEPLKRMKNRCRKMGFPRDAVEVRPGTHEYLKDYMDIDIALDTYPYPGGGTTCEALYLGIPVVTRYGTRHGSRFGYSLLENVGIGELAAEDDEGYLERAVALAGDAELLGALRRRLPQMMRSSPVMDARGYVRDVEAAYETIWRNFLESQK